jgi:hypothetical protein
MGAPDRARCLRLVLCVLFPRFLGFERSGAAQRTHLQ